MNVTRISVLGAFLALVMMPVCASALDMQGHRGARGLMPENTLPAFAKALSIGVTTLELDTGVTSDGVVIISHNRQLKGAIVRDANGKWLEGDGPFVNSLTAREVQSYDVGRLNPSSRYSQRYPDQIAVDGTPMPTLAELFDLVRKSGNTDVRFNIESKIHPQKPSETVPPAEFARRIIDVVREYGLESRTTIQSFDWRTLQEAKKISPTVRTAYLTAQQRWLDNVEIGKPGASPWTAGIDIDAHGGNICQAIKTSGGDVWSPFYRDISKTMVDECRRLGIAVKVWTVNEKAAMEEMIDMGVDGIITDFPDRLRDVAISRGIEVAKPVTVSP